MANPLISTPQIDDSVPFPQRPGTFWDMRYKDGRSWCANCGQGYNAHGGIAGFPLVNLPREQVHLTCPAPDSEWDRWYNAQRRSNVFNFTEFFYRELTMLQPKDVAYVFTVLDARFHRNGDPK